MELLLVCQLDLDQSGLLSYNFNTYDCRYVIEKKRFPECGSKDEQVGWFIGYFPLAALGRTVNKHYNLNLNL